MKRRYNFDRFHYGAPRAEGIAVHAESLEAATAKARTLRDDPDDTLRFTDNEPCAGALRCSVCEASRQEGS